MKHNLGNTSIYQNLINEVFIIYLTDLALRIKEEVIC